MMNMRQSFKDIKDWEVLSSKIIYDFSDDENPIEVIEVEIGTLYRDEIDVSGTHYSETASPIIRWISRDEYNILRAHEGMIVW